MSEILRGAVARVGAAVRGLLSLARVSRSTAAAAAHVMVDTTAHRDEALPYWQPYGLQAAPKADAIAVQAAVGGHADSLVTILVHDRRYTIALSAGEVALVDDLGQKVHLTRTGIVIDSSGIKLGASAALGVARATDPVGAAASMAGWITAVSAFCSVAPPADFGTITSGSSVVEAE